MKHILLCLAVTALGACDLRPQPGNQAERPEPSAPPIAARQVPASPPARPDPAIDPRSPEAASAVARHYALLLGERRFDEALALWGEGAAPDIGSFTNFRTIEAKAGAAGNVEGAAGSTYATVPFQLNAVLDSGERSRLAGNLVLRRVNDVPGSTEAQRRWHIVRSELTPKP